MGHFDIEYLLENMSPRLDEEIYVFASVDQGRYTSIPRDQYISSFVEEEGVTLILLEYRAKALNLKWNGLFAKITLKVHSDLEAVGFTAAFANLLKDAEISCNVVAGYYHDHIFVPWKLRNKAMAKLQEAYNT